MHVKLRMSFILDIEEVFEDCDTSEPGAEETQVKVFSELVNEEIGTVITDTVDNVEGALLGVKVEQVTYSLLTLDNTQLTTNTMNQNDIGAALFKTEDEQRSDDSTYYNADDILPEDSDVY